MISFLQFRSNALSSVALTRGNKRDKFPPNHWSKDDIESWVKSEYERHYQKELSEVKV